MTRKELVLEMLSWIAARGYLVGFYMLNIDLLGLYWFNVITLLASIIYVVYGVKKTAYSSAAVNVVFVVITVIYLIQNYGNYSN